MPSMICNGIEMHYEVTGQGDPLVFIHGLGSSARDWEYQIDFFACDYQVVRPDLRGHGLSEKPPGPYSMPLFAQDIAALISGLSIAPCHLVGISLGGMVALQLAIDCPQLVKSLTVVNSGSEMLVKGIQDRLNLLQRSLIVKLLGMRKMGEVLGGRLFPEDGQRELRETFIERWAENDPRAYQESLRAVVGWSVTDRLKGIQCPVLVISAEHDYISFEQKAPLLEHIPGVEWKIIKESRHATTVDQPEAFNSGLGDFLARQR